MEPGTISVENDRKRKSSELSRSWEAAPGPGQKPGQTEVPGRKRGSTEQMLGKVREAADGKEMITLGI